MLTSAQIESMVFDPSLIQQTVLYNLESATDGNYKITDPTNAFTMLLEAGVMTSSNSAIETKNLIRKLHPTLAIKAEDLAVHLSDEELGNMFATPATAYITFKINTMDLRNNGYRPTGANYVETTMWKYTEVIILETTFTLLNDIVIRLYDAGGIYVEQISNTDLISINDIGVIPNYIYNDNAGGSWISFEVPLKQVKRVRYNGTAISGDKFKHMETIGSQYYFSNITYRNSSTGNLDVRLNKSHNEEYLNPLSPTVCITVMDKEILYKIPDMYNINNNVNGVITIDTYETKGSLDLAINKYTPADFKIVRPDESSDDPSKASIVNIILTADSRLTVSGGSNSMSLEDMRKSIIFNTTGTNDLPISRYQLDKKLSYDGFELFKTMDILTERLFVASKNLPELETTLLNAKQDVFFNTVKIELDANLNNNFLYIKDDVFIIKSGTVFKEDNGIVSIVDNTEMGFINNLSSVNKLSFFKDRQYFHTPFYYVVNKEEDNTKLRVYDLDNPKINNLKIIGKNTNVNQSVNINKHALVKTDFGYRLIITIIGNDEFKQLNSSLFTGQLSIPLKGSGLSIHFEGTYDNSSEDEDKRYLTFDIHTSLFVDSDNYMEVTNGTSTIHDNFVNLLSKGTVYLFTYDANISDLTRFLATEIVTSRANTYTVLAKQEIDLTFGNELQYIYNKMYSTYTDRKYLKHLVDVPMVYPEDVYDVDVETGTVFKCNNGEIEYLIKHQKGTVVTDEEGNVIYKYRKGDTVIVDGKPVIDLDSGVVRYMDILMFEYIFKLANSNAHINYNSLCVDTIYTWLTINLVEVNSKLLDNTSVLYKSYKTSRDLAIKINGVNYKVPYMVKPAITLYTTRSSYSVDETLTIKNTIGKVIHRHLDKDVVSLSNIKDELKLVLSNEVTGIKITGLDTLGNLETLVLADRSTRLSINKLLDLNKNNELIVNYDIDLSIHSI